MGSGTKQKLRPSLLKVGAHLSFPSSTCNPPPHAHTLILLSCLTLDTPMPNHSTSLAIMTWCGEGEYTVYYHEYEDTVEGYTEDRLKPVTHNPTSCWTPSPPYSRAQFSEEDRNAAQESAVERSELGE